MNITDAIRLLRMFMDDSRDDYFDNDFKIDVMYQAQLRYIEKEYTAGNERTLLPLYRTSARVANGTSILASDNTVPLYPRVCRVFESSVDLDVDGYHANYTQPGAFFNYDKPGFATGVGGFPRTVNYTLTAAYDVAATRILKYLNFNGPATAVAELTYIKMPIPLLNGKTFETAEESHVEIVAIAAEMLNDIDVGEEQRGERGEEKPAPINVIGGLGG